MEQLQGIASAFGTLPRICATRAGPFVSSPKVRDRRNDSQMDVGGRETVRHESWPRMPKLLITSYNPLSAIDSIRRECILRELGRAHITCLHRTCVTPVVQLGCACSQAQFSTRSFHCAFQRSFQERNVARFFSPPAPLQGRFGAIRLRRDLDLCIVSVYMYTEPQKQAQQHRNLHLWAHAQSFVERLPARCVPVVCMDANAHVGLERGPENQWQPMRSASIGPRPEC